MMQIKNIKGGNYKVRNYIGDAIRPCDILCRYIDTPATC